MWHKITPISVFIVALSGYMVGSHGVAWSQDFVTDIGGEATAVGVVTGNQTALALGDEAKAKSQAGVIANGVRTGGEVTAVGVVLGNQTTVAIGEETKACSNVGVVGDSCNQLQD